MSTSGDQIVDEPGSHRSVHVFVVDEDGEPVTGQDVSARFSFAWGPDTVHHQYTDVKGHAEFLGAALGRAPAHDVLRAREIVWAVHGRGPGDIHGRNLPRVTPSGWNAARRASIRIRIYGTAPRQTPTRSTTHAVSPSFQPEHGGPRRQSEPCKRRTQVARPQSGSSTMAGQPNRS